MKLSRAMRSELRLLYRTRSGYDLFMWDFALDGRSANALYRRGLLMRRWSGWRYTKHDRYADWKYRFTGCGLIWNLSGRWNRIRDGGDEHETQTGTFE